MPHIPLWRVLLVVIVCLLGAIFAVPTFLSPTTVEKLPGWFPRHRVNLGLDLQGGSHLLLEVDVNSGLKDRLSMAVDDIRKLLRTEKIGYVGLMLQGEHITFKVRDPQQLETAAEIIRKTGGGYELTVIKPDRIELRFAEHVLRDFRDNLIKQSVEIVNRRINELGTRESSIQRQGENRIIVQLPGIQDPSHVKSLLGQTAKLTFRLVDAERPTADLVNHIAPPGTEILPSEDRHDRGDTVVHYVVSKQVLLTGEHLVDAQVTFDEYNRPEVAFRFNNMGGRKFGEITRDHVGRQLAIVLDNKVISAPRINGPIPGGNGVIIGQFTVQEANDLALLMRAGALPAPLTIIEERTVGPDLGADSITAGTRGTYIAVALVVVVMLVIYAFFGFIANVALIFNLVLLISALALTGSTLTLPGIAGIALTMGMAVDANVLIYERIKEELRLGRRIPSAIDAGYKRAMATILDSNLTTLIGAAALYFFGSGPIKGFGVTLSFGIIISMFTAIALTRVIIDAWLRWRKPKTLSI
jgi:preprotein translocase subunit SecD